MISILAALYGTFRSPRQILDRAEISELIDRYMVGADTADDESQDSTWYRQIFSDSPRLSFPIGEQIGFEGLAEFHRLARLSWQATHHVSANHIIDVDGDSARVRVQLIGTHVSHGALGGELLRADRFDIGAYYIGSALRTDFGWRIDMLTFTIVWESGLATPRK
ncbi:nuclear transport factor 2 family protein [Rhodococcus sp. IEGM 1330]|uniref:nuclear transport factor 2 family protein n=1 Tax=Rhodococcus sp. IEGM 1330 TaxID=3082225 RepID=UPI002953DE12|nr:nuclear transport factor 2 family protein [Rhodococcus sp. IEGM 1330]MDV8025329.1 nuclear transport factor 2 family protein [Rhodococcus sp. IEGM 1330]